MENEEIEQVKELLDRMVNDEDYAYSYEFEHVELINRAFEQLEKENAELKKQLQAKDKALDKACEELAGVWACAHPTLQTKEDWKEWCENGID